MAIEYTKQVIKHFSNPRNVGEIKNPDGKSMEGNPACGDMVSLTIKVDGKTKKISDIKFKSYGCASNIATASVLTEFAKGKKIDDAKEITWKQVMDKLGGLPKIKIHCSVLAVDTLKSAITDYERKNGLLKEDPDVLSEKNIKLRLKSVVNPATGADLISSNMVSSYFQKDGKIVVNLKICKDHEYAENIEEEIEEHVSTLNGFKSAKVKYSCK
ncbi:iron-sulfur cluster assembly scaffold protein [Candidatus Woesearchaeota archaeon]|nr:iron-sulfur cluster assembly scaffold protein [Candidatus Woesearchaeota archaeon]